MKRAKRKIFKSTLELKKSTIQKDKKSFNEVRDFINEQTHLQLECDRTISCAYNELAEQRLMSKGFRLAPVNTLIDREKSSLVGAMYPEFSVATDPRLSDENMNALKIK